MIRNKTLLLLGRLKDRMATIVLTLQISVQVLDVQDARAFAILLCEFWFL